MEMKQFHPTDPVAILSYLANFKTACDALGIHEGAAMWLIKAFMREPARSTLMMRLSTPETAGESKEGKLTTYSDVVNYLLHTYASDDVIAETEAGLRQFVQTPKMTEQDYATQLTLKVLRCGAVYSEARLIGMYVEGLHESIRGAVRTYWGEHPEADLNKLARHATSVSKLAGRTTAPQSKNRGGQVLAVDGDTDTGHSVPRNRPSPANTDTQRPSLAPSTSTGLMSDDAMLASELFALQTTDTGREDLTNSSIMDSGDACRVCLAWKAHATSKCPYLHGESGFVEARNRHFREFLKRRYDSSGTGASRGGPSRDRGDKRRNRGGRGTQPPAAPNNPASTPTDSGATSQAATVQQPSAPASTSGN